MGIVQNQSFKNTLMTYLGFGFGAINTLFLYTEFIRHDYYGLITVILSWALILMPLLSFGFHNTLIKFYSIFKTKNSLNSFLTLVLLMPIGIAILLVLIIFFNYDSLGSFISEESKLAKDYVWHIFIVAMAIAYFEIFYAWAKVHLKSVFGNFMKEVFHRVCIMILLFGVHFNWITVQQLIKGIVIVYILRMFIMEVYAFSLRLPVFKFNKLDKLMDIIKYSFLILIAASVAVMILDIDKVMIGKLLKIENAAYYSVAIYIASVIAVPSRAMHQITNPLTAQFLNENKKGELETLYKKSSISLLIISGLIFILIAVNIEALYKIIPEEFGGGLWIVLLIGLAKLYDNSLGNNNSILFNSDYYRIVLILGVGLAILTVVLNMIFIPMFGIEGAALATFIAIIVYNTIKLIFVYIKFKMSPFTSETLKSLFLIASMVVLFFFWEFPFHPILTISLKSIIVGFLYVYVVYKTRLSEDINTLIKPYWPFK